MNVNYAIEGLTSLKALPHELSHAHVKAAIKTMNREGTRLKTFLFKEVRSEYMIKTSDLKKSAKEIRASYEGVGVRGLFYELGIGSRPLPLSYFGAREKWVRGADGIKRRGVTVKIKRKGRRKMAKSAFLHDGHIFKREAEERYPLKYLTSLSIPQMFKEEIVLDGLKLTEEHFPKTYHESLMFYTSKI